MINQRQAHILSLIVSEFIATAQPLASKTIVDKFQLDVSPATVRNDMAVLEAVGLLRQPHTSSGRVPTEEGYRFYLEKFVDQKCPNRVRAPLRRASENKDGTRQRLRHIASTLVELSGETAISSLATSQHSHWMHYSGIAKLFAKPDFGNIETMRELSCVVDKFDEVLRKVFDKIDNNVNIWIGGENPFGSQVATVIVKYRSPDGKTGLLGLVGPLRMDYERNIRLLSEAKNLLDSEV